MAARFRGRDKDTEGTERHRTVPLTVDGVGSFSLIVSQPTLRDRLATLTVDWADRLEARLRANVVGWEDVIDEHGDPVIYSPDLLIEWLSTSDDLLLAVYDVLRGIYQGPPEKTLGESLPPRQGPSVAAGTATPQSGSGSSGGGWAGSLLT